MILGGTLILRCIKWQSLRYLHFVEDDGENQNGENGVQVCVQALLQESIAAKEYPKGLDECHERRQQNVGACGWAVLQIARLRRKAAFSRMLGGPHNRQTNAVLGCSISVIRR